MYSNINAKFWGNSYWNVCNSVAAMYPTNPDEEFKKNVQMFMQSLRYILPCTSCRNSYSNFSKEGNTNIYDSNNYNSKMTFAKLIYNLKQKVNSKLEIDYKLPFDYYWRKIELMSSTENNNVDYFMNTMKEAPFIQDNLKDKINNFVRRNRAYISNYKDNFTETLSNKLIQFCKQPDFNLKNKTFTLWIKRNKECNNILNNIYTNMSVNGYTYKISIEKDKKLWVKLFYLGCNSIPGQISAEIF